MLKNLPNSDLKINLNRLVSSPSTMALFHENRTDSDADKRRGKILIPKIITRNVMLASVGVRTFTTMFKQDVI